MAKTVKNTKAATADAEDVAPRMSDTKPAPVTAEDKLAALLAQAADNAALKAGEAAAATLNKGNRKTLEAWLKVGAAMVAIGEMTNGNPRAIGAIVATLPEFSCIPSPIRSNAKWLFTEREMVEENLKAGIFKGDHPTTLREQFNKLKASNQPADDGAEGDGEGNGEGNGDGEGAAPVMALVRVHLASLDEDDLRKWTSGLCSLMAEKGPTRKLLLSYLPKPK
jgi:hypothetical protein